MCFFTFQLLRVAIVKLPDVFRFSNENMHNNNVVTQHDDVVTQHDGVSVLYSML